MPHGLQIQQDATKLNPHGSSVVNNNKFQQDNEYYSINPDPTIVQIQSGLDGSNLTSLATQQLSQNNLWGPINEYDVQSMEMDRPAGLSNVISQIGLGSLVNFQNTVLGRFLGVGPQTPMIEIANSRLTLEFSKRVASQLAKNLLPTINLGGFISGKLGLGKEEPLIRPAQEFIITKLPFGERDTAYYVGLFTGFESNKNPVDGINDNKELIKRTGSGQVSLLKQNIEQNIFKPEGIDGFGVGGFLTKLIGKINKFLAPNKDKKEKEETLEYSYDPKNYIPIDIDSKYRVINDPKHTGIGKLLPPIETLESSLGFNDTEDKSPYNPNEDNSGSFTWRPREDNNFNRGLLRFTQTIVNSGHAVGKRISQESGGRKGSDTFKGTDGKEHAKGRNLTLGGTLNEYCRSWIKTDQYDQYKKLIRSSKHYLKGNGNLSGLENFSVLNNIGMPRIHPVSVSKENFKPMMFSIENLAWGIGDITKLAPCEQGPNDGRIMWFPPYDIQIDENITANWEKTDFIGRGEPVYTYNNSERTLNFQFKLIMDYPSNLRSNIDNIREDADKFFAGCGEKSPGAVKPLSTDVLNALEVEKEKLSKLLQQPETNIQIEKYSGPGKSISEPLKFYFSHNVSASFDVSYESASGLLNNGIESKVSDMVTFLNNTSDAKHYDLHLEGHASKPGTPEDNIILSKNRMDAVKKFLEERGDTFKQYNEKKSEDSNINKIIEDPKGEKEAKGTEIEADRDTQDQKESRFVNVWLEVNPSVDPETLDPAEKEIILEKLDNIEKQLNEQRAGGFIGGECLYFEQLKEEDPFIFKKYSDKIRFFHPSFHSQTPEDFNKRLVFLHQCTRQGKPFSSDNDAKNSVFGRMPVCVLRIGDFFNCRIIINNIGFSYEPLLWDLNPEGSGVQPMLCNVNVNCNIIGGSSLEGPVIELQNAISSKFYANHQETTREELEEFMIDKVIKQKTKNGEKFTREQAINELKKKLSAVKV